MLHDVPIFVGDEVAAYTASLPVGTDFTDIVLSLAPPFNKFFVDFQRAPNIGGYHAWGALVTAHNYSDAFAQERFAQERDDDDKETPRWMLHFLTFVESEEGKPVGPVGFWHAGLAEDGTMLRHANGQCWWTGGPTLLSEGPPPPEFVDEWIKNNSQLLSPVLLTISFLHCKNVKVREVVPPEKLSHKHRRKHGHDLSRYHVLDIKPLRRLLEQYRTGERGELRRALHICRGHFKTFAPDAPLLGRHTGTYWWAPQARGSQEAGIVLKDYRVNAPSEFGKAYREADETPPDSEKEAPPSKDPDSAGRGLAAHNRTQNKVAEIVRGLGWNPRSPAASEPNFDLAWKTEMSLFVCEVKSLTLENEERQLRMAIGQVIRYRQKLNAAGHEPVMTVIAAERAPEDQSWEELCVQENIVLVWPEVAEDRLREAVKTIKQVS